MWSKLGQFILKYRFLLLFLLIAITAVMSYWASKVELSYEFSRAIPVNHPASIIYREFKKKFGEDGNLLVIGIQTKDFFTEKIFNDYTALHRKLKQVNGVEDVIGISSAVNLVKNPETEKLNAAVIFPEKNLTQPEIDSGKSVFLNLPFYRYLLYNPETHAWLMGVRINKEVMNSKKRIDVTNEIKELAEDFGNTHKTTIYLSGLPYIRTEVSHRIASFSAYSFSSFPFAQFCAVVISSGDHRCGVQYGHDLLMWLQDLHIDCIDTSADSSDRYPQLYLFLK
jgi:predicted RND superfamily exporter protein